MRRFRVLLAKELRELAVSRSYWLMLLATGLLVGHAFSDAAAVYAEASGAGGGAAALSQGLNPLSGIVVPVLGAYDLVATLLLPFVVIRLVASERETGSLALLLQAPVTLGAAMAAKGAALLLGWIVAFVPGVAAIAWWCAIGGHVDSAEVATVILGHVLRGVTTIGVAGMAGALAASPASAAIMALAVTIGAWALDYAAMARGGVFQVMARYTPSAALRLFEQGDLRPGVVALMVIAGVAGLAVAALWLRTGMHASRRAMRVGTALACALLLGVLATRVRAAYDVSEDRRNSFAAEDEAALRRIPSPLVVTAHLAAEDPRLADLERTFAKLRRVRPDLRVEYVAQGRSGLFEKQEHYGEVWYAAGNRRAMTRSATEEIVLETLWQVGGVSPPTMRSSAAYPGYPLLAAPRGAGVAFLVAWPLLLAGLWKLSNRRSRRPA